MPRSTAAPTNANPATATSQPVIAITVSPSTISVEMAVSIAQRSSQGVEIANPAVARMATAVTERPFQ